MSLVGHGRPGSIRIGTERIDSDADGVMTAKQFQECIDPYVSAIEFWSCNTGEGVAGDKFLQDFADSIGLASGFTVATTASQTFRDTLAGGRRLGASATAVVPEPGALLLVLLGLFLLTVKRSDGARVIRGLRR